MTNFNAIGASRPLPAPPPSSGSAPVQMLEQSTPSVSTESATSQATAKPAVAPSPAELKNLVGEMQKKVSSISPELQFTVDKDSGKSIIKLTNRSTSEIVWQFPSEEALRVTRELDRFSKGLMVNRNV